MQPCEEPEKIFDGKIPSAEMMARIQKHFDNSSENNHERMHSIASRYEKEHCLSSPSAVICSCGCKLEDFILTNLKTHPFKSASNPCWIQATDKIMPNVLKRIGWGTNGLSLYIDAVWTDCRELLPVVLSKEIHRLFSKFRMDHRLVDPQKNCTRCNYALEDYIVYSFTKPYGAEACWKTSALWKRFKHISRNGSNILWTPPFRKQRQVDDRIDQTITALKVKRSRILKQLDKKINK